MTRLRQFAAAVALFAAPLALACAPYSVIQKSGPPSAMQGVKQVGVRFDWSQAQPLGKSEAEYLSEKTDAEKQDFQVIKQETDAAILQGLQTNAEGVVFAPAAEGDAGPQVLVQYGFVQTGIYTHVYNVPSKVQARFSWSREGQVTDVIETQASVAAGMTTPSDHQRMEMVGRLLGKAAARFFNDAQSGK